MRSWFKRQQQVSRQVPAGLRVHAIGDIHGRLDLLDDLLDRIAAEHVRRPVPAVEVIFLGDYIDRGPQSSAVLDRLIAGPPPWARWTFLRGNHEDAFLRLLTDEEPSARNLDLWLDNGGRETLRSYGLPTALAYGDDLDAILAAMRDVVPKAHVALLRSMPLMRRIGDYLFVHAGIRPGVPLDEQCDRDLMWIRDAFLDCPLDHGPIIVHGHSITPMVVERPNRIGIDTGAFVSGRLTALLLEGDERRYLSTGT